MLINQKLQISSVGRISILWPLPNQLQSQWITPCIVPCSKALYYWN